MQSKQEKMPRKSMDSLIEGIDVKYFSGVKCLKSLKNKGFVKWNFTIPNPCENEFHTNFLLLK